MGISLAPEHLKRYKDIAGLLMKYGRSDMVKTAGLERVLKEDEQPMAAVEAEDLAADLERLGPTFVKLGQVLSTRADILPPAYIEALGRLQDRVEPFAFEDVLTIIASELEMPVSRAFRELDPVPVGSASLGQVHVGILPDGREVAVKVQRPGVRSVIMNDLEVLEEVASFLDGHSEAARRYQLSKMVAEFRRTLLNELDYEREARNLEQLHDNLKDFRRLVVPRPIADRCTSRVLTMEYVRGTKITEVPVTPRMRVNAHRLVDDAFRAYLKQIFVDAFFHADPHPGNVLLTDDNRLALIDLGMVGHLRPRMQEHLLRFLLAVADGNGDNAATLAIRIGRPDDDVDEPSFRHRMTELVARQQTDLVELDVGRTIMEICYVAGSHGITVPAELTMLGKLLLHLDQVARVMCPAFNPADAVKRHALWLLEQRLTKQATLGNAISLALEVKELAERMPQRINRILDILAQHHLTVRIDVGDEMRVMDGLQKVANRIALAMVLAALIVGGALLMQVQSPFRLFGLSGIAMACFITAVCGAIALAVSIIRTDR